MSFFTKALKGSVAQKAVGKVSLKKEILEAVREQIKVNPFMALDYLEQKEKIAKKQYAENLKAKRESSTLIKVGTITFSVEGKEKVVPIEERKNPDGTITRWAITRDGNGLKRLDTLERQCAYHKTETTIEWNKEVPQ